MLFPTKDVCYTWISFSLRTPMELPFWIAAFAVSLLVLIKGTDRALVAAERIGAALGLSSFVIGVVIVGLGTSLPELASSLSAVFRGAPEIVAANVIGSNIANILLVGGISAVIGNRLSVTKNLIDLDLPLLSVASVVFLSAAWDRMIVPGESILLLAAFSVYIGYTTLHRDDDAPERDSGTSEKHGPGASIRPRDVASLVLGFASLVFGANYMIEAVLRLSGIMGVGTGVISLAAVALGTSLPELTVSIRAAMNGGSEVALGNIFGSNVFNLLFVIGIPGLFGYLPIDDATFRLGLPYMLVATALFVVSGISRRIHVYEGAMYVIVYAFFLGQLLAPPS